MSRVGKHALVALFYAGTMSSGDKGYLNAVLDEAKKDQGFGRAVFVEADAFSGHPERTHDFVMIEGTVPEELSDRIEAAYKAIGKEVAVLSDTFKDEFRRYEERSKAGRGVTADPPANATDNSTASLSSPQAHIETDGRNDPQPWTGKTGTVLDRFGLPLATTDAIDASADQRQTGLNAQTQAVSQRADSAASEAGGDAAERAKIAAEQARQDEKARAKAAKEEKEAREKAEKEKAELAKKAQADADAKAKAEKDAEEKAKSGQQQA